MPRPVSVFRAVTCIAEPCVVVEGVGLLYDSVCSVSVSFTTSESIRHMLPSLSSLRDENMTFPAINLGGPSRQQYSVSDKIAYAFGL